MCVGFVYRLWLEDGKYYIGHTSGGYEDIGRHFLGEGCEWTRRYRPIGYDLTVGSEHDLVYWVLSCMVNYGYNNVRGGYWEGVEDLKNPPPVLGRFRKGKSRYNRCVRCGLNGHNVDKCKTDGDGDMEMRC